MHIDCIPCFRKQAERLIVKHGLSEIPANEVRTELNIILDKKAEAFTSPEVGRYLNSLVKSISGITDLYAKEKKEYNEMILQRYDELNRLVQASDNPKFTALRYALAGNIIDFGPPNEFNAQVAFSEALQKEPSINHSETLFKELNDAKTVLYLGDNAGEIVADKLFIETIKHPNLYFAVRGSYVMNDITMEDAHFVGIDQLATVISNGYDAPSTILSACSPEFMEIYNKADIIISKGQGNLEGLIKEKNKNIYFLLMVKCDVMARQVGVNQGDVVVWNNQST
jgi:damage-control phosphatase, subfamily I